MKICITGASGFVGRGLIPMLQSAGASLLLVGRDFKKLAELFPSIPVCTYAEFDQMAKGFDCLVHLSVVNNDSVESDEIFHKVNVDLTVNIANAAKKAAIPRMINISSIHALDEKNNSKYALSKREGAKLVSQISGINIETVYLPLVYHDQWKGKLEVLNRLPRTLALRAFGVLGALKPVVHVQHLANLILETAPQRKTEEVILVDNIGENFVYGIAKRTIDLAFCGVILALFGWLLVIIWVVITLQFSGTAIFAQERVGQFGKVFTCYKFRTMKLGTIQAGTHEVLASSITPFGGFLRRTKLDELPQIWNILKNEVSLIGPRPCLPTQISLIDARRRLGVLALMPGISGMAQVKNVDMSDPEKLAKLDARYLKLRCLALDIKLILATALGGGQGDKVIR